MKDVVIIDGVRSPIGAYGGALSSIRPDDLLADVLKGLVTRTNINPQDVSEVYAGCGNQSGEDNRDVARMSALLAGFPTSVPGVTINRNCSSALDAINLAAKLIQVGDGEMYIGSGVECMSRAPWSVPKPEKVPTFTAPRMWDTTVGWRYNNPKMDALYPIISLGETAENIADEMQITREEQDVFAVESHRRAVDALNAGRFKNEVLPIEVSGRKGMTIVDTDEHPRYRRDNGHFELSTSLDDLAKLRPAFRKGGTVTAGNSSGINDGAAAVLLADRETAEKRGMKPMVRWIASASAGVDPSVMGYGPVPATAKVLAKAGLKIEDIGLFEINEAFAAQAIGCMRRIGMDPIHTNVNGGAIALGHPTGCSGSRILVTLIHEMKRRSASIPRPFYGLATLCVGVGMGVSTIVEWIGD
jgi:acetyl-CoA acetyltransferase family protein